MRSLHHFTRLVYHPSTTFDFVALVRHGFQWLPEALRNRYLPGGADSLGNPLPYLRAPVLGISQSNPSARCI